MYELVKHRLVPYIEHSACFQESIADHALQMLPMPLPESKAQLRFEKAPRTSGYYVIQSKDKES